MSARTLWLGIKAEAQLKVQETTTRMRGLQRSLSMLLVTPDVATLETEEIASLALELAQAKITLVEQQNTLNQAKRELGE